MKDLRVAALCTLGFAGFFRFSELSNMLCKHIVSVLEDHIKIFVPHSKTDVYREGNFVYIAKILSKCCPVSILLRYMRKAKLTPTGDLPQFSPLSKTKSGYMMRSSRLIRDAGKCSSKLSVSWDAIRRSMACIVYDRVGLLQS